jgi:hypothetical protein
LSSGTRSPVVMDPRVVPAEMGSVDHTYFEMDPQSHGCFEMDSQAQPAQAAEMDGAPRLGMAHHRGE